jgi:cysteine desulfurase
VKDSPVIYLDSNATTALDPRVWAAMERIVQQGLPLNPSSLHSAGQQAKALLAAARHQIAQTLGVKPQEVVFTSGATESLNLLIRGLALPAPGSILVGAADHKAAIEAVRALERDQIRARLIPPTENGIITPQQLAAALDPSVRLIVMSAANSETGLLQDVEGFGQVAAAAGVPLVIDAVAVLGKAPVRFPMGVSGFALSGHKAHGPTGTGLAVVRAGQRLRPLLVGGGQEHGRRSGTEATIAWHGLAESIRLVHEDLHEASTRMARLRDRFEALVGTIPGVHIIGQGQPRLCNTSCLAVPGCEGEVLVIELDRRGVCVSHGTACSAGAHEPSPALRAMGLPEPWVRSAIRVSLGRNTTEEQIELAAQAFADVIASTRARD